MTTKRAPDSGTGDFRSPEVIAAAERDDLIYLDKAKKADLESEAREAGLRIVYPKATTTVAGEPEIPRELFGLGNSLDEQDEVVKTLREVLAMVTRRVDETDATAKEARPECFTDLGDKLADYLFRVNQHTKELKYLLRSLEL